MGNGMMGRFITARPLVTANIGSMVIGAMTNGAARIRTGGAKAAMALLWAWITIATMAFTVAGTAVVPASAMTGATIIVVALTGAMMDAAVSTSATLILAMDAAVSTSATLILDMGAVAMTSAALILDMGAAVSTSATLILAMDAAVSTSATLIPGMGAVRMTSAAQTLEMGAVAIVAMRSTSAVDLRSRNSNRAVDPSRRPHLHAPQRRSLRRAAAQRLISTPPHPQQHPLRLHPPQCLHPPQRRLLRRPAAKGLISTPLRLPALHRRQMTGVAVTE
jgi:hypothetical protein